MTATAPPANMVQFEKKKKVFSKGNVLNIQKSASLIFCLYSNKCRVDFFFLNSFSTKQNLTRSQSSLSRCGDKPRARRATPVIFSFSYFCQIDLYCFSAKVLIPFRLSFFHLSCLLSMYFRLCLDSFSCSFFLIQSIGYTIIRISMC